MTLNFTNEVGDVVATRSVTLTQDKGTLLFYAPPSVRPDGRASVRADVVFYDGDGRAIGRETLWLAAGQTGMADFAITDMPEGWRSRIRAAVHVESLDGRTRPLAATSVEVFAADTGRSVLFYPGALIGLL